MNLKENLRKAAIGPILGSFLFFVLGFDKGFTYLRIHIGPLPIFVTEIYLGFLILAALVTLPSSLEKIRSSYLPLTLLALFCSMGALALFRTPSFSPEILIPALKRSALCYYCFFTLAVFVLIHDNTEILTLFKWMFAGSIVAVGLHLAEMLGWIPGWWPVSTGIANTSARLFGFLYAFFIYSNENKYGLKSLLLSSVFLASCVFTGIRSVLILMLIFVPLVGCYYYFSTPSSAKKHFIRKFAIYMLIFTALFYFILGLPVAVTRFKEVHHAERVSLPLSNPNSSKLTSNGLSHKEVDRGNAPTNTIDQKIDYEKQSSLTNQNKEMVGIARRAKSDIGKIPDPLDNFPSKTAWQYYAEKSFFSSSGNFVWRFLIWGEGTYLTLKNHPLIGMGVGAPFVSNWVSPYKSPKRMAQASALMSQQINFYKRISGSEKDPSREIPPSQPLGITENEQKQGYFSMYWYDIDFHNSFVSILYRFGLVGFFSFLGIFLYALIHMSKLTFKGNSLGFLLAIFLLWYAWASSFNVVLEGPFMGAVYWIILGICLSYVEEGKRKNEFQET